MKNKEVFYSLRYRCRGMKIVMGVYPTLKRAKKVAKREFDSKTPIKFLRHTIEVVGDNEVR